ncbi:MAG: hypothetical protein K2I64_06175 [Muribaculaceae bacterium]|nr:hypothetical protein [Muribaculaceae bacterium]
MKDFKKRTGVNYDFILSLQNENGKIIVVKYPIIRHSNEIARAIEYLNDENADASDIYNALHRCLFAHEYDYCLNHEYSDSNIAPIKVSFYNYEYASNLNTKITSLIESKVRQLSQEEKNNRNKLLEIRQLAWKQMYRQIRKDKEQFLNMALPYVYANDYEDTLILNRIKERSIVFSHERHGDDRHKKYKENSIEHKVNNDISIKVETNFCYGMSSYFHVIVIYKGIALLPYSEWVKYFYARYNCIMRYTRTYRCIRESWIYALNFLEGFINKAIENPDEFVKEDILSEVNGLMVGLEEIFRLNNDEFEKRLDIRHLDEDDDRYIGISSARHATEQEREDYKIKKSECAMIYKIEKISGALYFLDNLRKLKEIYSEISDVIERIIEMNRVILPDVEKAIPPIKEEINELNNKIDTLKNHLKSYENAFERLDKQLYQLLDRAKTKEERNKIEENYKQRNPRYEELRKIINDLYSNIYSLKKNIKEREKIQKNLLDYKTLIFKYTNMC